MATEVIDAPAAGSLNGRVVAVQALLTARGLLLYDDLWTDSSRAFVGTGQPVPEAEPGGLLSNVVGQMRDALHDIEGQAYPVRMMLDELSNDLVDEGLGAICSEHPFGEQLLADRLKDNLDDYDLRGAAIEACDYVREEAAIERGLLTDKLNVIASGEATTGDLRPPFRCALSLLMMGSGVLLVVASGGGLMPVAAGLVQEVGSAILEFDGSGCRQTIADITRGRR